VAAPAAPAKGELLVRVEACSVTPGDWRMLSGDTRLMKKPKAFPYIPGGDVSGRVEAVGEGVTRFKVGDEVIGTWSVFGIGGFADLTLVHESLAVPKPAALSHIEASALANSAPYALLAVQDTAKVKRGDRVLILGGSGGIGTSLLQLVKHAGASFVATTTTQADLARELGADLVVDHTKQNWWEVPEVTAQRFDVVFDAAEGTETWLRARNLGVVKTGSEGGRWVTFVPHAWHISMTHWWDLPAFIVPIFWRSLWTRALSRWTPRYSMQFDSPEAKSMARVLKLVEEGHFRVILAPETPFPFTTEGVVGAFDLLVSRRAHGKIVVDLSQRANATPAPAASEALAK